MYDAAPQFKQHNSLGRTKLKRKKGRKKKDVSILINVLNFYYLHLRLVQLVNNIKRIPKLFESLLGKG